MTSDNQIKLVTRLIKVHEKHDYAAKWGCTYIFTLGDSDAIRATIGKHRGCEVVVAVLAKHAEAEGHDEHDEGPAAYEVGASPVELANRALVSLCVLEENRLRFNTSEACQAVVKSLKSHMQDAGAVEWACAAMVSLTGNPNCIGLLGYADACAVLSMVAKDHLSSEIIMRLTCELVNALAKDDNNRTKLGASGMCEALPQVLDLHAANANVSLQVSRAAYALMKDNEANVAKLSATTIAAGLSKVLVTHAYNTGACRWAAAAIALLAQSNPANQAVLDGLGCVESLVGMLEKHRTIQVTIEEVLRAIRQLAYLNAGVAARFSEAGVLVAVSNLVSLHSGAVVIAEHLGWIVGHCAQPSDTEFTNAISTWERLESTLRIHAGKENAVRWLCMAIGKLASLSNSPRTTAADLVLSMLQKHASVPNIVSKAAYAIGCLAVNKVILYIIV
jgi:hypothetical protein